MDELEEPPVLTVTAEDLTDWNPFLKHNEVLVDLSLDSDPTAQSSFGSATPLKCVNNIFWGWKFASTSNKYAARIGQDVPGFDYSTLLRLSETEETLKESKFKKSISELLQTAPVDETAPDEAGPERKTNIFSTIVAAVTSGVSFTADLSEDRNAMWLTAGNTFRVDTSLSFKPVIDDPKSGAIGKIQETITSALGINSDKLYLRSFNIKRTSRCFRVGSYEDDLGDDEDDDGKPLDPEYEVITTQKFHFQFVIGDFVLWIGLEPRGVQVAVTPDTSDPLTDGALQSILPSSLSLSAMKPPADLFNAIRFLRLQLALDLESGFTWGVTFVVVLKGTSSTGSGEDDLELYLDYDSMAKRLSGGAIFEGFYAEKEDYFHPDYSPFHEIELPKNAKPPPPYWDLRQYLPASVPSNLPLSIAELSASVTLESSPTFTITGTTIATLDSASTSSNTDIVPSPFVWDELGVYMLMGKSNFECSFFSYFTLNPPPGTKYEPAALAVTVDYSTTSGWLLHGRLTELSCGLLFSFFEETARSDLVNILGDLKIANLDLVFTYDSSGAAASFLISGAVQMHELELRLFYQYTSSKAGSNQVVAKALTDKGYVDDKGQPKLLQPPQTTTQKPTTTAWVFECDLGAASENATIGSIANAFVADAADSLPSFVSDIKIPKADGSNGRAPVYLKTVKDPTDRILFVLRLAIGVFSLTFVQVGTGSTPKRLVRFAADILPTKTGIPLIDELPQPFEQLDYLWVNDTGGFLKSDVDAINDSNLLGADVLIYKVNTKTGPSSISTKGSNPDPVVIAPGHHFVVVGDGTVLLDHVFSASPAPKPSTPAAAGVADGAADSQPASNPAPAGQTVTPPAASPPTKGSLLFNRGPLAISAMALQFKEEAGKQCLVLTFDATFTLGPLSFSLLGFGLSLNLKGLTLDNLQGAANNMDVALAGMAVAFNKPPILIAGGFEHQIIQSLTATQEVYLGGIAVSFPPYTFNGIGEYAIVQDAKNQYKSVFIYAKLDGPLIQLELATISGVRLGFGFNSFVRSPTINELTSFPLINDNSISSVGNEPMAILKNMTSTTPPWVTPKLDSYWLAAGLSIQAFDVLTATAVAVFEFGDAGLAVGIYADAVAQMPAEAPQSAAIVYVEIGMKIELNFADGYFAVMAMLAPTSFLLVPQCRLTGGMALSYWFPPNENAGDWVFTVGGYHRSYTPPAHYPVVPRLGIAFQVGIISITGQSYFAITPKSVMAGAMIHASLSFGPIEAWLDAAFDALINFHPFHYDVEFRISVGVSFNLDILFIHIHISVMIGADLHLQGPEFGGTCHIDFYLFSFDVSFGAPPLPPPPLDLLQFWLSLHKPGPEGDDQVHQSHVMSGWAINFTPQQDLGLSASGAAFKFILEDGNSPQPKKVDGTATGEPESTGAGSNWFVKGGSFKFRISTDFAVSNATLARSQETLTRLKQEAADPTTVKDVQDLSPSPFAVWAKPMQVGAGSGAQIRSTLAITVKEKNSGIIVDQWRSVDMIIKEVPTAIWAPYDPSSDPRTRPADLLHGDDPTVSQAMALAISSPFPELCPPPNWPGFIPKFKATAAAKMGILDFRTDSVNGTSWFIPKSEPTQTQYVPRSQTEDEKKESNQAAWDGMESTWGGLTGKDELTSTLAGTFASMLGWDKTAVGESPREKLVGSLPKKLIKNLEQTYLSLPRIATVSA